MAALVIPAGDRRAPREAPAPVSARVWLRRWWGLCTLKRGFKLERALSALRALSKLEMFFFSPSGEALPPAPSPVLAREVSGSAALWRDARGGVFACFKHGTSSEKRSARELPDRL